MLAYWVSSEGHGALHPTRVILQECWEHREIKARSFGWFGKEMAQKIRLTELNINYYWKQPKTIPKKSDMDNSTKLYTSIIP